MKRRLGGLRVGAAIFAAVFVGTGAARAADGSFMVAWGNEAGQLGLSVAPEQERLGPLTFAVASSGNVVVADSVHRRLVEFAPDGKFVRTVGSELRPTSIGFDAAGNLLLLLDTRTVAVADFASGKVTRTLTLPEGTELVEGYHQDVFAEGDLIGVNDPDENVYLFGAPKGERDAPTTATAVRRGRAAGGAGTRAFTKSAGRADAVVVSDSKSNGDAIKPAAGRELGGVLYRGAVGAGSAFEVEEIDPDAGKVHLLLKSAGGRAGVKTLTELPNDYYTTVYRKFEILPDGTCWQMRTTPTGVEFTRSAVQP